MSTAGVDQAFWAAHAWVGHPARLATRVRIETRDGQIHDVRPNADPQPGDRRLPGVVFPGLANAHSHAFHRALRGRTHRGGGSFWSWRDGMYSLAARLTPDGYYALARAVYAEMVQAGMTAVGEFHYVHHQPDGSPYGEPTAMGEALCHAAADAGIRLTLLDTCYLQGGFDVPLRGSQVRFSDGSVHGWIDRVERLRLRAESTLVGAAVHSVRAVPEAAIRDVAAWAQNAGVPLHVHVSEQIAENEECLAAYGRTPVQVLTDAGALGAATTAVHATHLTGDDIAALGVAGTAVCACPTTEQDLADGLGPMRALADAGSPICLGSDQHAVVDPMAEARSLEMHERLSSGRRGNFAPSELVAAMSADGYAALGRPGDGRIAIGAAADLVAVGTDSTRTAGADPAQLMLVASAADVQTVVVAGRVVVDRGQHRIGDVAALLHHALPSP